MGSGVCRDACCRFAPAQIAPAQTVPFTKMTLHSCLRHNTAHATELQCRRWGQSPTQTARWIIAVAETDLSYFSNAGLGRNYILDFRSRLSGVFLFACLPWHISHTVPQQVKLPLNANIHHGNYFSSFESHRSGSYAVALCVEHSRGLCCSMAASSSAQEGPTVETTHGRVRIGQCR